MPFALITPRPPRTFSGRPRSRGTRKLGVSYVVMGHGEASLARDEAWAARVGALSRVGGAFVSGVAPVSVT